MSETGSGRDLIPAVPPLGVLYINPAGGCNLHCRHCWVNEGAAPGGTMELTVWLDLLEEARGLGCTSVKLTGGEPFLYTDIVSLYRYIGKNFGNLTVETNGTLRPDGIFQAFEDYPPTQVSVSIDSADEDTHDNFRGVPGSWRKSVEFAGELVKMKITNQIIMSISTTEREPVENMIGLVDKLGAGSLKINFITPSGRGIDESFYRGFSVRDALEFFRWLTEKTPEWVLPSLPVALVPVNRLAGMSYCPVRNLLGVLPDGTFSLCGVGFSRKEMAWGRYPEVSLEEAWNSSPVLRKIREILPAGLEGVCAICLHRDSCIGRCIVNNNETGGSPTSPDAFCQAAWEAGLFPATRLIER